MRKDTVVQRNRTRAYIHRSHHIAVMCVLAMLTSFLGMAAINLPADAAPHAASGSVSAVIYTDKKLGFSLTLPPQWSVEVSPDTLSSHGNTAITLLNHQDSTTRIVIGVMKGSNMPSDFALRGTPDTHVGPYPAFNLDDFSSQGGPDCAMRVFLAGQDYVIAQGCSSHPQASEAQFVAILASFQPNPSGKVSTAQVAQATYVSPESCSSLVSGANPVPSDQTYWGSQLASPSDSRWNPFSPGASICDNYVDSTDSDWYGYWFQCTELANRFDYEQWGLGALNGNAGTYYPYYQNGTYHAGSISAFPASAYQLSDDASQGTSAFAPHPGDLLIYQDVSDASVGWTSGITGSGHVAIIVGMDANYVYIAQQNMHWGDGSEHPFQSLPYQKVSTGWKIDPYNINGVKNRITRGWIHFTVNTGTSANSPVVKPDLYAIARENSAQTEVHRLVGNGFQQFNLQVQTPLPASGTDNSVAYLVGDYNGDGIPDLWAIYKANTGTNSTEVHILDGASNFQNFLLQSGTALQTTGTDLSWDFALGDYNHDGKLDLWCFSKNNTGSGTTEVHILDGANNFQSFLLHTSTALSQTGTDATWRFLVGDYNQDGHLDVYAIDRANTGSGMTEVHILDGANNFQSYLLHIATPLGATGSDASWEFALGDYSGDGKLDLYCIDKANTGSGTTEVHILDGASNFQTWDLHSTSALGAVGDTWAWEFALQAS